MDSAILLFGAFLGSFVSGVAGMGGGALLIGVMAFVLPAPVLIPAHGLVQIGSNLSRSVLHWRKIDFGIAGRYLAGALLGTLIGMSFTFTLSERVLEFCLGSFILLSVWGVIAKVGRFSFLGNYTLLGTLSTVLSLFVGVAGPLLHPFILREKHLDRFGFIGTESICAGTTHFLKVCLFFAWGVSLLPYLNVLLGMIGLTFVGAYLGKKVVNHLNERDYRFAVRLLISLLALRLISASFGV